MATAKPELVHKRPAWKRFARALLLFAGLPYLGILLLLAILQRSLIYGPIHDDTLNTRPTHIPHARIEPLSLTADGNLRLNGWHIIAERSADGDGQTHTASANGRPLILYFCGN